MDFAKTNGTLGIRSRASARKTYDRLSRWYDLLAGSEDWFTFHGLQMVAVGPGEKVLEIGPGTGKALLKLAPLDGESGLVVGLDLSWGMIKIARGKVIHAGLDSRVSLTLGDGSALPYAAGSWNVVFMGFTLELFSAPEIPRVLNECARVLRPEGRLGVVSLAKPDRFNPMVSAYEWTHRRFPEVVDCRPIPAGQYLEQAGFFLQDCQRKQMWGMPVEMVIGSKIRLTAAALNQTPVS